MQNMTDLFYGKCNLLAGTQRTRGANVGPLCDNSFVNTAGRHLSVPKETARCL